MKTATACSKPKRCPACGSKEIENIIYSSRGAAKENEVQPKWRCSGCGVKIFLKTSRRCRRS